MKIHDATLLITGANRGIGLAFAREALARGARKVYAGARDPARVTLAGVIPVRLDVTRDVDIAAAADTLGDVTILVNNAGIGRFGGLLEPGAIDAAREQLETNYFGPWRMSAAFAPILAANGGGAILNVLSVASWVTTPTLAVYATSKAAAWSLTNALRHALRAQGTQVLGLHMGFVDTDLVRDLEGPKSTPEAVVRAAFDALEAGAAEVAADDLSRAVKAGLAAEPAVYLGPPMGEAATAR